MCVKSKYTEDTTLEDLFDNPAKYGAPSFTEFSKQKEKYMGSESEAFEQVDKGSLIFKKGLRKFRFEILGYRCKTLEEVERICREQGINIRALDFQPEFIPLGGGEAEMLVRFVSKDERDQRNAKDGAGLPS
jgi:hypothetical protein